MVAKVLHVFFSVWIERYVNLFKNFLNCTQWITLLKRFILSNMPVIAGWSGWIRDVQYPFHKYYIRSIAYYIMNVRRGDSNVYAPLSGLPHFARSKGPSVNKDSTLDVSLHLQIRNFHRLRENKHSSGRANIASKNITWTCAIASISCGKAENASGKCLHEITWFCFRLN